MLIFMNDVSSFAKSITEITDSVRVYVRARFSAIIRTLIVAEVEENRAIRPSFGGAISKIRIKIL